MTVVSSTVLLPVSGSELVLADTGVEPGVELVVVLPVFLAGVVVLVVFACDAQLVVVLTPALLLLLELPDDALPLVVLPLLEALPELEPWMLLLFTLTLLLQLVVDVFEELLEQEFFEFAPVFEMLHVAALTLATPTNRLLTIIAADKIRDTLFTLVTST